MPYPSYGWRVHDDSTAKSLGQKPLADGERIEIAKALYRDLDPLANIEPTKKHAISFDIDILLRRRRTGSSWQS